MASIGIGKGSSVIVPVNTFVATANAVEFLGARPIFCDVTEDGEIDVAKLGAILETNHKIDA